ncbi:MAG: phosphoglucosamine mutase [Nitrososphaeraceae archaeon]
MNREDSPKIFGTNGVRGIFGQDLSLEFIMKVSRSLASFFAYGPLLVGFDGRLSSPVISKIVSATLNSSGIDTSMAGLLPTPCLQFAAKYLSYRGGIMITASHNPPEYNGIKAIANDGVEISRDDESKIELNFNSGEILPVGKIGRESNDDRIISSYIDSAIQVVNPEKIYTKGFRIVMDIGNGTQALAAPIMAQKLGCKVLTVNGNIDGTFPGRGSEPTTSNLSTLTSLVRSTNADFGVAYDGDGDRSIFCDENGQVIWGDRLGASLIAYLLKNGYEGTDIVCPVNTTMLVNIVAQNEGSKVIHTKVGSVEVSREMVKRNAMLGLEENGGFMNARLNCVRDGALTTLLVLEMLSSNSGKRPLSEKIMDLPQIYQYKSKFPCKSKELTDRVIESCSNHGTNIKVENLDGVKIWIDEETWVMVRASGTEPLIRIYAESTDKDLLDSKVREYNKVIGNVLDKDEFN